MDAVWSMETPEYLRSSCKNHTLVSHVAVLHDNSALLVKYRDPEQYDGQTGWFLPNDSLRHVEHPEEGAKRVLKEQLGLQKVSLELVQIESFVGDNGSWHLIFDFKTRQSDTVISLGKDIAQAKWVEMDKLPPNEEFAHGGWGRGVLLRLAKARA